MKRILHIVIALLCTSCSCDFSIPEQNRELFQYYNVGDTIYFEDKTSGDLDTMLITSIDSIEQCGAIMVAKRKYIGIEIKHLPKNIWKEEPENEYLNQVLFWIEKLPSNGNHFEYYTHIEYRNFTAMFSDSNFVSANNPNFDLKKAHWSVPNTLLSWPKYQNDSSLISNVIWTKEYGLTEYNLRNGACYKIKLNR